MNSEQLRAWRRDYAIRHNKDVDLYDKSVPAVPSHSDLLRIQFDIEGRLRDLIAQEDSLREQLREVNAQLRASSARARDAAPSYGSYSERQDAVDDFGGSVKQSKARFSKRAPQMSRKRL